MASFFNKPQLRRFHIEPRYWDKSKEDREKRLRSAKQDLGITEEEDIYVSNIKGKMRSTLRYKKDENRGLKPASTTRMIIIFVVLFLLVYGYFLDWDYSILTNKFWALLK